MGEDCAVTAQLLVAQDVAELPRAWRDEERRGFGRLVDEAVRGQRPSLDVAGTGMGRVEVVPAFSGQRLYLRRGATGSAALFGLRPAPANELLVRPTPGCPSPRALASLSETDLRNLGIPAGLVRAVRGAPGLEALLGLGLPAEVLQKVRTFCVAAAPADLDFVPEILKYEIDDVGVLRMYYLGDVKRLLLNLEPHQRQLVDLLPAGPILVKGVAGSGKTTVALYRARRLLQQSAVTRPRVLVLSYTKALTQVAQELLHDLCEIDTPELEVKTVHSWCYGYLELRGLRPKIVDGKKRQQQQALRGALADVRNRLTSVILGRDEAFWSSEFSQVIKGRCSCSRDDYMKVERVGRGTGLDAKGREVVWQAFEAYQHQLRLLGVIDWDDVVLQANSLRERDTAFVPYDHVFLDEAQDFPVLALRLVARLSQLPRGLFVMADARQSIYQHGFRWKDVGIEIRGGVHTLKRNYRATVEIAAAADRFRARADIQDGDDPEMEPPVRRGPKPKLISCNNWSEEVDYVAQQVARLLRENAAAPANIAVLARHYKELRDVEARMRGLGVPTHFQTEGVLELGSASVKLLTLHSAKGLEFPIVYVVGVDAVLLPTPFASDDDGDLQAHLARERRLLYVGMTRAMQDLSILYSASTPSMFIGELPQELFERRGVAVRPVVAAPPPSRPLPPAPSQSAPPLPPRAAPVFGTQLTAELQVSGLEVIDKRPQGGALWVIGGPELRALMDQFLERRIRFTANSGSRSTQHRPAWWTTCEG